MASKPKCLAGSCLLLLWQSGPCPPRSHFTVRGRAISLCGVHAHERPHAVAESPQSFFASLKEPSMPDETAPLAVGLGYWRS
jgi:hypothetical protein